MNSETEIRKKLALIEAAEPIEFESEEKPARPPAKVEKGSGSVWDFRLPEDWKPELRYVKEEPDYAQGFEVGDKFMYDPRPGSPFQGKRQAVPKPNYNGKVGELITEEMEADYDKRWSIWNQASMSLEGCIHLWRRIQEYQGTGKPDAEQMQVMFDSDWQWLKGLWAATGLKEPSIETLAAWSIQQKADWAANFDARQKEQAT